MPISFNGSKLDYVPCDLSLRVIERDMIIFKERTGKYPTVLRVSKYMPEMAYAIVNHWDIHDLRVVESTEEDGFTLMDETGINKLTEWF